MAVQVIPLLQKYAANVIEQAKLTPPVVIELFDFAMRPIYKVEAYLNEQGVCMFRDGVSLWDSPSAPGSPFRVQFKPQGAKPFVRDWTPT